jgi:hypothetical protein
MGCGSDGDVVRPSHARGKDKGPQSELGRSHPANDIRHRPKTGRRGSYELLVEERLVGIYLAMFVHRDAEHLARGASFLTHCTKSVLNARSVRHAKLSKSAVTTGPIGGRVGNKGAVGISLKIANII